MKSVSDRRRRTSYVADFSEKQIPRPPAEGRQARNDKEGWDSSPVFPAYRRQAQAGFAQNDWGKVFFITLLELEDAHVAHTAGEAAAVEVFE